MSVGQESGPGLSGSSGSGPLPELQLPCWPALQSSYGWAGNGLASKPACTVQFEPGGRTEVFSSCWLLAGGHLSSQPHGPKRSSQHGSLCLQRERSSSRIMEAPSHPVALVPPRLLLPCLESSSSSCLSTGMLL